MREEEKKEILEEIGYLEEEIRQDEGLSDTSDFHHVVDRLIENREKLAELKELIGEEVEDGEG